MLGKIAGAHVAVADFTRCALAVMSVGATALLFLLGLVLHGRVPELPEPWWLLVGATVTYFVGWDAAGRMRVMRPPP